MELETRFVHSCDEPDGPAHGLSPIVDLSTTFAHGPAGEVLGGYLYTRVNNPTVERLERQLAELEGGAGALAFGSGVAAGVAYLQSLPAGARVVFQRSIYSDFLRVSRELAPRLGLNVSLVDACDTAAIEKAIGEETALVWIETPSNPLLEIIDIERTSELVHRLGAKLLVDATFATPALQQPIALGADVVLHSLTKYVGGHSDVQGGALILADDAERSSVHDLRTLNGAVLAPLNAWLISRGLKTLPCRMAVHCRNASALADALAAHDRVFAVHYPGLPGHPNHEVACRQMRAFGGMVSIELVGGRDEALAVASRVRLFRNATSLGGVESLVEHRASIEGPHGRSPEGLLRFSVGLEGASDLIADVVGAIDAVPG